MIPLGISRYALLMIARFFTAMIVAASAGGCSSSDTARWTEEVKSWDGSVFQLEGRAEIGANGWPLAHRGLEHYIEYYHRPTKAYWHSPGGYDPVIFDLVNGVPYVVILIYNGSQCYVLNYPEKGLLIYRWNADTGWQPVKYADMPPHLEFNLMQQVFDTRDKKDDVKGFVSLAQKAYRDGGNHAGEFARWMKEYGDYCGKEHAAVKDGRLRIQTDQHAPVFAGFHGVPHF